MSTHHRSNQWAYSQTSSWNIQPNHHIFMDTY